MWCPILEETAEEPFLQKGDSVIISLSNHFSQGEGLDILEFSDLLAYTQWPAGSLVGGKLFFVSISIFTLLYILLFYIVKM